MGPAPRRRGARFRTRSVSQDRDRGRGQSPGATTPGVVRKARFTPPGASRMDPAPNENRPPPAPGGAPPSPGSLVMLAALFGLVGGYLDVGMILLKRDV